MAARDGESRQGADQDDERRSTYGKRCTRLAYRDPEQDEGGDGNRRRNFRTAEAAPGTVHGPKRQAAASLPQVLTRGAFIRIQRVERAHWWDFRSHGPILRLRFRVGADAENHTTDISDAFYAADPFWTREEGRGKEPTP